MQTVCKFNASKKPAISSVGSKHGRFLWFIPEDFRCQYLMEYPPMWGNLGDPSKFTEKESIKELHALWLDLSEKLFSPRTQVANQQRYPAINDHTGHCPFWPSEPLQPHNGYSDSGPRLETFLQMSEASQLYLCGASRSDVSAS